MIIAVQALVFFRESLFTVLDRLLRPYYKFLPFTENNDASDDEESDDHVFAEHDDEKGVVFYPPVYSQRYAAVADCLMDERWCGKLEKVVDLGCHDTSFIKYLKDIPGIQTILGVDIESLSLQCSSDLLASNGHISSRKCPLQWKLLQGNAADPDYRLIGCDAVVAIEMIEHMLPHDLERLVHTIFGFIKPWVAVITTPNGDFNPLFKALEKNGLRRLDHFFEWSREQFHDWCTNIVVRYPQYTVSCKGIGPGPPGTEQYGCCSQLALFTAKEYCKQQDLCLNSLALVAKSTSDAANVLETFESVQNSDASKESVLQNDADSYTELVFSNNDSCVTVVLSSTFSTPSTEYNEKSAQCNRDMEVCKNFLMFDDEQLHDVVVPRRKISNRVYSIEDLNTRLNCTTLHVKKFSKGAQNLMAKNKSESKADIHGVLNEIKHLMKVLNFDKKHSVSIEADATWHNINWGDDAPFWNQYYKIVREYSYPIKTQSEESLILDLISEEINMLADSQHFDDFTVDSNKLEIPIDHLMRVVRHITGDVDRISELLEWNGYEVVNGVVITRPLNSVGSDGDDAASHLDAEVFSTTFSDSGAAMPDQYGRSIYRALHEKVRKLQSMSGDQNISEEVDRALGRLLRLAARTAVRSRRPLPKRWTHYKLLELFTLMEKSLEKKKRRLAEDHSPEAICQEKVNKPIACIFQDLNGDSPSIRILEKYHRLVLSPAKTEISDNDDVLDDDLICEDHSNESVSDYGDIIRSPSLHNMNHLSSNLSYTRRMFYNTNESFLPRSDAQIDGNLNVIKQGDQENIAGDTVPMNGNSQRYKYKKDHKKCKRDKNRNHKIQFRTINRSKISLNDHRNKIVEKTQDSLTNIARKLIKRRSGYNFLIKTCNKTISTTNIANNTNSENNNLHKSLSKRALGCMKDSTVSYANDYANQKQEYSLITRLSDGNLENIATMKESCLIDIITECTQETIAFRRTIGTDAEIEIIQKNISESLTNILKVDSLFNVSCRSTKDAPYTIPEFLDDLNAPSTSKGVRHVSMDVQCGPDKSDDYPIITETKSFVNVSRDINATLKFCNSKVDLQECLKNNNCGTIINENFSPSKTIIPRVRPTGITIKDSGTLIADNLVYEKSKQSLDLVPATASSDTTTINVIPPIFKGSASGLDYNNTSYLQTDLILNKDYKDDNSHYDRLNLCRGIIYIHSYKDKHINEDVVYQGEWQRCIPKFNASYKVDNPHQIGKTVAVFKKKTKLKTIKNIYKLSNDNNVSLIKQFPNKNFKENIVNRNSNIKAKKNIPLPSKSEKSKKKAESKILTKLNLPPRNIKTVIVSEKPTNTSNAAKQVTENAQNSNIKNYIPLYLKRRRLHKPNTYNRNTLISNKENLFAKNYTMNQDNTQNFTHFNTELPKNISYVVFRNEIELKQHCSTDTESPKSKFVKAHNTDSLNNSASSSLNSTVVKKVRSTKITCKRNVSGLSDKSNCVKNGAAKIQKPLKKCDNPENIKDDVKENIMSISNKYNKSATITSSVINHHKFRARISAENSPNISRETSQQSFIKSNVRRTSSSYLNEKHSISNNFSSPVVIKQNIFETTMTTSLDIYNSATSGLDTTSTKASDCNTKSIDTLGRANMMTVPMETENYSQICINKKNIDDKGIYDENVTAYSKNVIKNKTLSIITNTNKASTSDDSFHDLTYSNMSEVTPRLSTDLSGSAACLTIQLNNNNGKANVLNIADSDIINESINKNNDVCNAKPDKVTDLMRYLIEERLNFITASNSDTDIDCKTVVLNNKQLDSEPISRSTSFHDVMSINSIISDTNVNKQNVFLEINKNNKHNDSIVRNNSSASLSEIKQTVTDFEMLSFKSITSVSKLSEYFLAESLADNLDKSGSASEFFIQEIFERKPLSSLQSTEGAMELQAISGFSMNTGHKIRNQPDLVNFIDSETGSIAMAFARQTVSEEVLLSTRSSDSYETCGIDDDTIVPNWLFQAISLQTSEEVDNSNDEEGDSNYDEIGNSIVMPLPIVEPIFDGNGNIIEPGIGASAGAGDGHGIHSDNSEDSSGNGTSFSSSETSEPQSEAVIIDPTALTTQYGFTRTGSSSSHPVSNLRTPSEHAVTSRMATQGAVVIHDPDFMNSSGDPQCLRSGASDIDADVSSTDTDVPDSSDN